MSKESKNVEDIKNDSQPRSEKVLNYSSEAADGADYFVLTAVRDIGVGEGTHLDNNNPPKNFDPTNHIFPEHVVLDHSIIAAGAIAAILNLAVYIEQQRQEKEQASTAYFIQQLAHLYKFINQQAQQTQHQEERQAQNELLSLAAEYQENLDLKNYYNPEFLSLGVITITNSYILVLAKYFRSLLYRFKHGDDAYRSQEDKYNNYSFAEKIEQLKNLINAKKNDLKLSNIAEQQAAAITTDDEQKNNELENNIFSLNKWLEKDKSNIAGAARIAAGFWKFATAYSVFYWVGWFFVWLKTGAVVAAGALAISLSFGLPLLPILAYGIFKFIEDRENKEKPSTISEEAKEKAKKAAAEDYIKTRALYVQKYFAVLTANCDKQQQAIAKKLGLESFQVKNTDFKQPQQTTKLPSAAKRLQATPAYKITRAGFFRFLAGYLGTYFAAWPITAFLGTKAIFGAAIAAAATGGTAIAAIAVIGLVIGIWFAVKKGTETSIENKNNYNLVNNNKTLLQRLKSYEDANIRLKNDIEKNYQKFKEFISKHSLDAAELGITENTFKPKLPLESLTTQDRFWRRLTPETSNVTTMAKKAGHRFKFFIALAGSGALLMRSLIFSGSVLLLLNPVGGLTALIAAGVALALCASFKLYDYHQQRQQKRDEAYVNQAAARLKAAEEEYNFLNIQCAGQEKLIENIKSIKTMAASKRMANRQKTGVLATPTPLQQASARLSAPEQRQLNSVALLASAHVVAPATAGDDHDMMHSQFVDHNHNGSSLTLFHRAVSATSTPVEGTGLSPAPANHNSLKAFASSFCVR